MFPSLTAQSRLQFQTSHAPQWASHTAKVTTRECVSLLGSGIRSQRAGATTSTAAGGKPIPGAGVGVGHLLLRHLNLAQLLHRSVGRPCITAAPGGGERVAVKRTSASESQNAQPFEQKEKKIAAAEKKPQQMQNVAKIKKTHPQQKVFQSCWGMFPARTLHMEPSTDFLKMRWRQRWGC